MNNSMRRLAAGLVLVFAIWPVLAQEAAPDASAAPETAAADGVADAGKGKKATLSLKVEGGDTKDADGKPRGITITLDSDDHGERPTVASKVVDRVIGELERALEKLPAEVQGELDDEDIRDLRQAIRDIEQIKSAGHIEQRDDSVSDIVPGVVAIVLLFGGPVLIVAIISFNNRRKRQLVHQTIDKIIEQGRDVPVELLDALDKGKNGKSALAKGTTNIAIGIGICVWLYMVAGLDVATIGLIPLFIGIAQFVVWKLEKPAPTRVS